jgi:alginate O-acetyltransferase complex protein AlgI
MLFNSPEFIVFFVFVYGMYLLLPFRPQNIMLLIASYVFYGWWDTRFLFLVALSTTVDFWVGLMLENGQLTRRQKLLPALFLVISALVFLGVNLEALWAHHYTILVLRDLIRIRIIGWVSIGTAGFLAILYVVYRMLERSEDPRWRLWCLMVSLVTQLGLLGVFKYFNFFFDSLVVALNNLGIDAHQLHLNIVLPVGVSFYTFQSLSYTIDIYREQFKPTDRFFDFALFVAYFPQLQAGPIERGRQLIPQLSRPRLLNIDQFSRGMYLIVLGFFKKIAIADGVAPIVDQVFSSNGRVSWIDVIVGAVLFAVQIYCDFSGYTDIARGLSKMFGIDLMVNFNQPYFATNPQDFWRRWHISLSTWLRDYLYVPVGGNRGGLLFVCRNLMIAMLLGGLWHGAAWNFVLWGFYQGALLCTYRVWIETGFKGGLAQRMLPFPAWQRETLHFVSHIVFFLFICYGWLIFRAHSLAQIIDFTSLLVYDFGDLDYGAGIPRLSSLMGSCLLFLMEVAQYCRGDVRYYRRFPTPLRGFHIAALIAITIMGMSNEPAQFIYFQF